MLVQTQAPADKMQLQQLLQQAIPGATVTVRGPSVVVGRGLVTGIQVTPRGQGQVKLVWASPSMVVMILLIALIVLTWLIGGVVFLVVWLASKGGVDQLKQEVAAALQGGAQPYGQWGYGQAGYGPQGGQFAGGGGYPQPGQPQPGGYPQPAQLPPGQAPPGQLPPGGGWGGQQ